MQPFRPEVAARLAELAPLLLDQLDAMTDRMIDVLLRTEPAYRELLAPRRGGDAGQHPRQPRARAALPHRGRVGQRAHLAARRPRRRPAAGGAGRPAGGGAARLPARRAGHLGGAARRLAPQQPPARHPAARGRRRRSGAPTTPSAPRWPRATARSSAGWPGSTTSARQQVLDGLLDGRGGDPAFVRTASELLAVPLDGPAGGRRRAAGRRTASPALDVARRGAAQARRALGVGHPVTARRSASSRSGRCPAARCIDLAARAGDRAGRGLGRRRRRGRGGVGLPAGRDRRAHPAGGHARASSPSTSGCPRRC